MRVMHLGTAGACGDWGRGEKKGGMNPSPQVQIWKASVASIKCQILRGWGAYLDLSENIVITKA